MGEACWSVVLTDDEEVCRLNLEYRGEARTTDVLAFCLQDSGPGSARGSPLPPRVVPHPGGEHRLGGHPIPVLLGDVVISVEQAARQCPGGELEAEILLLLVHGLCHLRGYLHSSPGQARRMRLEEQRLLTSVGELGIGPTHANGTPPAGRRAPPEPAADPPGR